MKAIGAGSYRTALAFQGVAHCTSPSIEVSKSSASPAGVTDCPGVLSGSGSLSVRFRLARHLRFLEMIDQLRRRFTFGLAAASSADKFDRFP